MVSESAQFTRSGNSQRRRRRRRLIIVAVLVAPLLIVGGFAGWLNHIVTTNVQHADLLGRGAQTAQAQPLDIDPFDPVQGTATQAPVPLESAGDNYLLIGSDARAGLAGARSDVIILMHVPLDKHNVTLVHFPRDMYVYIPGRGQNKINAAFAFGGAPLLVQTIQSLLGIKINHVAMIGFEGFKQMTDAVGGVDVYVEEGGTIDGNVFTQGMMHLNGAQALAFVRERYDLSQGDISRGRRQQAFLKALMLKATSKDTITNPVRLATFIDAATRTVIVDDTLDIGAMRQELLAMAGLRAADIRFITAPFTGFGTSPYGASIVLVDFPKLNLLGTTIREDRLDDYA